MGVVVVLLVVFEVVVEVAVVPGYHRSIQDIQCMLGSLEVVLEGALESAEAVLQDAFEAADIVAGGTDKPPAAEFHMLHIVENTLAGIASSLVVELASPQAEFAAGADIHIFAVVVVVVVVVVVEEAEDSYKDVGMDTEAVRATVVGSLGGTGL